MHLFASFDVNIVTRKLFLNARRQAVLNDGVRRRDRAVGVLNMFCLLSSTKVYCVALRQFLNRHLVV